GSRSRGRLRFRSGADFLSGITQQFEIAKPGSDFERHYRQNLIGAWLQDDIKLSRDVTVNAGVRYEMVTTPHERDGKVSNLRNILDPAVTVGDPLFLNPTKKQFAPRLGRRAGKRDDAVRPRPELHDAVQRQRAARAAARQRGDDRLHRFVRHQSPGIGGREPGDSADRRRTRVLPGQSGAPQPELRHAAHESRWLPLALQRHEPRVGEAAKPRLAVPELVYVRPLVG